MTCSIPGCGKTVDARQLCAVHYKRLRMYGDPLRGPPVGITPGTTAKYILENVLPYDGDECLLWPYARNSAGYGHVGRNGRNILVTRIVCEAKYGAGRPGDEAAHKCGNGHNGCVAPKHLRWATHIENKSDEIAHGTRARGQACPQSKLTEDSVREIRRVGKSMPRKELAVQYGVSPSNISQILRGFSWGWLDG